MHKKAKELGSLPLKELLLKQSIPAIVGMMVFALYNVVDTIFIGRSVGPLGIAGVAIAFPITMIVHGLGMAFGIGAASIISRALGAKNKDKANAIFTQFIVLVVVMSIVASLLLFIFLTPILSIFGATSNILPFAQDYMRIVILGLPFFAFAGAASHVIRAEGKSFQAMLVLGVGTVVNLILDPILIFGFDMGIKGAALATTISHIISTLFVIGYFLSKHSSFELHEFGKNIWKNTKEISFIGSPTFVRMASMNVIAIIINVSLSKYSGDLAIAAYGIINRFLIFSIMPVIGIVQGMQPILGFNFGAKQFVRVKKTFLLAAKWSTGIAIAGFVVFLSAARVITQLFTSDDALISLTVHATHIVVLVFPFIGFQIIAGGFYQALGKAKASLWLTLLRQVIVFLPVVLLLPLFWGIEGVWWSFPLADSIAGVITFFVIRNSLKELK